MYLFELVVLFFAFFIYNTQEWNCWIMQQFHFQFFEEPPYCFPQWLHQQCMRIPHNRVFFTYLATFFICRFFDDRHSDRCEVTFNLIISDVDLFICLLAICISSLEKYLFRSPVLIMLSFYIKVYELFIFFPYCSYRLQIRSPIQQVIFSFC